MAATRATRATLGRVSAMLLLAFALAVSTCMLIGNAATKAHADPYTSSIGSIVVDGSSTGYGDFGTLASDLSKLKNKDVVVTMYCDWDADVRLEIPSGAHVTLNMQGNMLDRGLTHGPASGGAQVDGEAIIVQEGAVLTIDGGPGGPEHTHDAYGYTSTDTGQGADYVGTVSGGYITGGASTNGSGGINVKKGATVTLSDVTIGGCRSQAVNPGKSGEIMAGYGGGMYLKGGSITVNLNGSTIMGNFACGDGGGIYADSAGNVTINLSDSHIDANYANSDGGGINLDGKVSSVTGDGSLGESGYVAGSTVSNNQCVERGGGILAYGSGITVSGLALEGNHANSGGGLCATQDKLVLRDLLVSGNEAAQGGGLSFPAGPTAEQGYDGDSSISNCQITGNTAVRYGGVYCDEATAINGKRKRVIGGVVTIKDNVCSDGSDFKNLCIASNEWYVKAESFSLSEGSEVWVSWEDAGDWLKIGYNKDDNCAKYIHSDQEGYCYRYDVSQRMIDRITEAEAPTIPDSVTVTAADANDASLPDKDGSSTVSGMVGIVGPGGYPGTEFELIRGFASHGNTDEVSAFYYSDGLFYSDAYTFNEHLATASLTFSYCGGYMNGSAEPDGNLNTYYNKHWGARQFLADIGCSDQDIYVSDSMTVKPGTDSIGVTIGSKKLMRSGSTETGDILVPVAVRGFGYEAEWVSNVTIGYAAQMGTGKEAKGFSEAADQVFNEIEYYLKKYNLEDAYQAGKVKFWVTGFSRAGATANLVSKRLVDKIAEDGCDSQVFCYSCEAPKGGTDSAEVNGNDYRCIHNMINKVDVVPYVAPGQMGFKRYGVDHYVPGTQAGEVKKTVSPVAEGGDGAPPTVTTYVDNSPTLTKTSSYYQQRSLMTQHLTALNPDMEFNDAFQPQKMDFISIDKSLHVSFLKVEDTGDYYDNHAEDFVENFIWLLVRKSDISRDKYARDNYTLNDKTYPSIQTAAQNLMKIEKLGTGLRGVIDNAGNIKDEIPYISFSIGMFDDKSDFSLYNLYRDVIGNWHSMIQVKKEKWTNGLLNSLKKSGALDKLSAEEKTMFQEAFPTLLDVVLTIVDNDYNYKPVKNESNQWAKGSSDTMMYIPTFIAHANYILQCHDPNVCLAWAESYDSWYADEINNFKLAQPESVDAPAAYGTVDGKKKELELAGREVNKLYGDQRIVLENTGIVGEAIYYDLYDVDNGNELLAANQLYRGGIDLALGEASKRSYEIAAYDMSYGVPSLKARYRIDLFDDQHNVIVRDLPAGSLEGASAASAEAGSQASGHAGTNGPDLMAGSIAGDGTLRGMDGSLFAAEAYRERTYTYAEGQRALVQADVPDSRYFKTWKVDVLDEFDTVIRSDVEDALLPGNKTNQSPSFTMPKAGESYPAGYQLRFTAQYGTRIEEMMVDIVAPVKGQALPKTLEVDFDNGISETYRVSWMYQSGSGTSARWVPTSGIAQPGTVYHAVISIDQDQANDILFASDVDVAVGGQSDKVQSWNFEEDSTTGSIIFWATFKKTEGADPAPSDTLEFQIAKIDLNTDERIPGVPTTSYLVNPNTTVTISAPYIPGKAFMGWDFGKTGIKTTDGETAPSEQVVDVKIPSELLGGATVTAKYVPSLSKVEARLYDKDGKLFEPHAGSGPPARCEAFFYIGDDRYEINPDTLTVSWSPEIPEDGRFAPLVAYTAAVKVSLTSAEGAKATISVKKEGESTYRNVGIVSVKDDDFKALFNGNTKDAAADFIEMSVYRTFPATPYTLGAVKQPDSISGVPHSAGATAEQVRDMLPSTTSILMTHGAELDAEIKWDVPTVTEGGGDSYAAMVWTATGTVKLPDTVDNPDHVNLDVSMTVSVEDAGTAFAPAATLDPGEYLYNQETKLDTLGEAGTTYYTTDGTDPTTSGTRQEYTGKPIYIDRSAANQVDEETGRKAFVIRAYTTGAGMRDSDVATFTYVFSDIPVPQGAILDYTGEEQIGVEWGVFYTLMPIGDPRATLDDLDNAVAIDPGVYLVEARLDPNSGADRWATSDGQGTAENQVVKFVITGEKGDRRTIVAWADPAEGGLVRMAADPDDGSEGGSASDGGTFDVGTNVTVHATPNSGYVFVNWMEKSSESIEVVSTEADYSFTVEGVRMLSATFARVITVRWLDYDDTVLYEATYNEGEEEPAYQGDTTPTRPATAAYTFTFTGWDLGRASDAVKTYRPLFDATLNKYDVTFVDEDGTVIKQATPYDYDTLPKDMDLPQDPVKPSTAQYSYTFDKWVNVETGEALGPVMGDATYKPTFTATLNRYSVKFVDDDGSVLLGPDEYDYGTSVDDIAVPDDPSKAAEEWCSYEFAGWDPEIADVVADATYRAVYTKIPVEKYQVTFVNYDGTVLQTSESKLGDIPSYKGSVPTRAASDQCSYVFTGWSPEIAAVTGDVVYTALFEEVPLPAKKASLTFDLGGGTLDGKTSLVIIADIGDVIEIPAAPTRDGYEFKYWKGSEYYPGDKYTVEGDHAFTAQWEQKPTPTPNDESKESNGYVTKPVSQKSTSAKTGDSVPAASLGLIGAIAMIVLALSLVARRRDAR